jgi:hypothetical protein
MRHDVSITNHGHRMRFELLTDLARDWVDSYIDTRRWMGKDVFVVDQEMGAAIRQSMVEHGLNVG